MFTGLRSAYTVTVSGSTVAVTDLIAGRDGTDTLSSVERLRFADKSLALDITGNAGTVGLILGAVFGKGAVANQDYVGTGLRLLDGGMGLTELVQFAQDARLGACASSESVVTSLCTNVVGVAPGAFELAYFTGLLQAGQYTPTSPAIMAMRSPENSVSINLTGMALSGIEYTTTF